MPSGAGLSRILAFLCSTVLVFISHALHVAVDAASQHARHHDGILGFNASGMFKIVQLTDLHLGQGAELDAKTLQVVDRVLELERPVQLVIISGDLVSGYAWNGTRGWYKIWWEQLAAVLASHQVYYAITLGNHDGEADLSRAEVMSLDMSNKPWSLSKQGPVGLTGASNYWLDIMAAPPPPRHRLHPGHTWGQHPGAKFGVPLLPEMRPATAQGGAGKMKRRRATASSGKGKPSGGAAGKAHKAGSGAGGKGGLRRTKAGGGGRGGPNKQRARHPGGRKGLSRRPLRQQKEFWDRGAVWEGQAVGGVYEGGRRRLAAVEHPTLDLLASSTQAAQSAASAAAPQLPPVALRLWMLDTMQRGCGEDRRSWGCAGADMLHWLRTTAGQLPPARAQIAFAHIPVPEFMALWNTGGGGSLRGVKAERISCPAVHMDTGMFSVIKSIGVTSLHCGHDHENNFHGTFRKVRLSYGAKTGFGSYGPAPGWSPGAKVILLRLGTAVEESEMWVRFGNGTRKELDGPSHNGLGPRQYQGACNPGGKHFKQFALRYDPVFK